MWAVRVACCPILLLLLSHLCGRTEALTEVAAWAETSVAGEDSIGSHAVNTPHYAMVAGSALRSQAPSVAIGTAFPTACASPADPGGDFSFDKGFVVSMWYLIESVGAAQTLFAWGEPSGNYVQIVVSAGAQVSIVEGTGGIGPAVTHFTSPAIAVGNYHHITVAFAVKPASAKGDLTLYMDTVSTTTVSVNVFSGNAFSFMCFNGDSFVRTTGVDDSSRAYGVRYALGVYPCTAAEVYYKGSCYFTTSTAKAYDANECANTNPAATTIDFDNVFDDWFVTEMSLSTFTESAWVGYVKMSDATPLTLWSWDNGASKTYTDGWCGNPTHRREAMSQWDGRVTGCDNVQQPNTPTHRCGCVEGRAFIGLLDRDCGQAQLHLCKHSPLPPTPAPPTSAPPTPAPPTSAPPTSAPPTPAPPTSAPPTPAPPTSAPPTPAPDTLAPPTPAPPTSAPPTSAPPTPAPPTSAPPTPAPPTPAPPTSAPPTPAPDTLSPPTPAPPTSAPDTPAPDTPSPPTPAPPTSAPDTPAPDTPSPPTPAPPTSAPDTPAPDTLAPPTSAPPTSAPPTPAPDTPSPPTPAPDTLAPPTPAPDTPAPDTLAPATSAPPTPAPDTSAPPTPAPPTSAPPTSAPDTPAPDTLAPATAAPPTPAPDTSAPPTPAPATSAPLTPAPLTPAPQTLSPPTPAPLTPSPPTLAPPTQAPATPAPPTTAPLTIAPATLPPATTAPATNAPATTAPLTPAPPTPAPATVAPLTSAPLTTAPATLPPVTAAPLTPSPATSAPATAAPLTSAPSTIAPATTAPDTGAPPTPAPLTLVPPTVAPTLAPRTPAPLVPPTAAPDTTTPETDVPTPSPTSVAPATLSPTAEPPLQAAFDETDVPRTSAPIIAGSSAKKTPESASAATASAAVSTSGGRVKALMNVECKVDDVDLDHAEPLDWEFHPLLFGIGTHNHKYFLGAVVSNIGILLVFLLVNYCMALVQTSCFGISWGTALFYVRAPGLLYLPLIWLLMGTSMAASGMAFFPSRAPAAVAVLGWIVLIGCASLPLVMWRMLLRPARFHATNVPDPRVNEDAAQICGKYTGDDEMQKKVLTGWQRHAYIMVFGRELWVRKDGADENYVAKWGLFFETYRGNYHWFSLVEMVQIMFLAFSSAWKPTTFEMCVTRNVMITIGLAAFFFAIAYLRPYNSTFDYIVACLMSGMMFVAVALMSIALIMKGEPKDTVSTISEIAGFLLLISAMLLAFKGAYDIILYLVDIFIGRRKGALDAAAKGSVDDWQQGRVTDELLLLNSGATAEVEELELRHDRESYTLLEEGKVRAQSVSSCGTGVSIERLIPVTERTVHRSADLLSSGTDPHLGQSQSMSLNSAEPVLKTFRSRRTMNSGGPFGSSVRSVPMSPSAMDNMNVQYV